MKRRGWRVALVVLFLMACAGAATEVARIDAEFDAARAEEAALTSLGNAARRAVLEVGAAQRAYVAAGQNRDYWLARVTATLELATDRLADLARAVSVQGARLEVDSAAATMAHFGEMDARARDLIGDDETVPASDLIFTDGLELTDTAHAEIDAALTIERAARADALRASRKRRTAVLVAVAGAGLLFLLLLVPATEPAGPAKTRRESISVLLGATAMSDLRLDAGSGSAQADRESSSNDAAGELRIEEAEAGAEGQPNAATDAPIIDRPDTPPDLAALAALCTDLGRVSDSEQLPALLQRAAGVIGASGIIVWLRDGSGQRLRAVTSHGYSAQTLGKMGDLPCDGDNAAATAFRTARMQVAERQGHGNSAVVAPLIAAEGCVGVMTAELPENATSQTRALASIVAAQLVVLLGGSAETDAVEPEAAAVDVKRGTA